MECKVFIAVTAPRAGADLIETLWNVKIGMCKNLAGSVTDLIETLWNVKRYNITL